MYPSPNTALSHDIKTYVSNRNRVFPVCKLMEFGMGNNMEIERDFVVFSIFIIFILKRNEFTNRDI